MIQIKAKIGHEPYKIEIESASGRHIIADEPIEKGGKDRGFSPKELLASSLAACTCATVRMYAERKGWELNVIRVVIKIEEGETGTVFNRDLQFDGQLNEEQQKRLLNVANACPVHKILTGSITINTQMQL